MREIACSASEIDMDQTGDHRSKGLLHQRYVTAGAAAFAFWQDIPEGKVRHQRVSKLRADICERRSFYAEQERY